jgi:hypothetical protein
VKQAVADQREVRPAIREGNQLAVEDPLRRKVTELRHEGGHVPAATRTNAETAVAANDRPKTVPLELEGVVAAR